MAESGRLANAQLGTVFGPRLAACKTAFDKLVKELPVNELVIKLVLLTNLTRLHGVEGAEEEAIARQLSVECSCIGG
jgi:hypothetical protein